MNKAKDLIKELEKNPEAELFILTEHMGMPYPRRFGIVSSNGRATLIADDSSGNIEEHLQFLK